MECRPRRASSQIDIYLVHSEIPLENLDLVQSLLERRVIPGGGDKFELVLCLEFPLDDEFTIKAGVPALVFLKINEVSSETEVQKYFLS